MAAEDDSNLKIGISLDTSKLPADARRAERTIKAAVESTTAAVEQQGKAAEASGQAHTEAAQAATAAQQQTAQAVDDTTAAVEKQQTATQQTASATADGINKTTTAASGSIQQVGKAGTKAVGELGGSIRQGTEAVGGFTKALNIANGVMGVLTKGFAVIGLINQVAASIQLIVQWWEKANATAVTAGQKFMAAWKAQRQEAELLRRQNAGLEALQAQEAAHDRILAKMRAEHAFAASMRAMEARREGNLDEAEKATLDGMLARGEISETEHIDRTRAVDDAARDRRQADELAPKMEALTEASTALSNQQKELSAAVALRDNLLAVGKATGLRNDDGSLNAEAWGNTWTETDALIQRHGGDSGRFSMLYGAEIAARDQAAAKIQAAAEALHISLTKTENGETITRSMPELAKAVQETFDSQLKEKQTEVNRQQTETDTAAQQVSQAQSTVDALQDVHRAENARVAEEYRQHDLTLAHTAHAAAVKAATDATNAEADAARDAERAALDARVAATAQQADAARSAYSNAWHMEQERATPEQSSAMAAINRLLTRGEKEPRALEQLLAMLSGQDVTLTEDEARRYGADFQLAKSGALTGDQQAAISIVVQQLLTALQAEAAAKQVGEEVDAFNRQEAATARAEQQAELDRLRAEADAAQARADEATARLQRYETASGGKSAATAPTSGPATAVPEPAPMPPVDDALRQAGDIVQQHNDFATRTTNAMAQFNTTSAAALSALSSQQASITRLTAENAALRQQISNLARANV